ncbi:hypothetical protein LQ567_03245 [Niabella pedocola]|uniref:Uncharacterized protein n=1 Tax=Niabella pedocola TaxID=1752077 RepID=A0ABS8PKY2_9BACT|nr:hypothetical protein [Niabella pedocola]MCD2421762.1 hypothetical protein [Niabella pedocola]
MKKLFAIALIAVSFAACNSSETKQEETPAVDSTTVVVPAPTPAPDTATVAPATDSAAKAAADSIKK